MLIIIMVLKRYIPAFFLFKITYQTIIMFLRIYLCLTYILFYKRIDD